MSDVVDSFGPCHRGRMPPAPPLAAQAQHAASWLGLLMPPAGLTLRALALRIETAVPADRPLTATVHWQRDGLLYTADYALWDGPTRAICGTLQGRRD